MSHSRKNESFNEDFAENVILVSSVQSESAMNFLISDPSYEGLVAEVLSNELDPATVVFERTEHFIKNDGTIASHLNFTANQYASAFVDRPHMHWTWNGLVHANSGGDWETARIAYLEPLSEFAHVFSCAPYDTMVVGSHTLSRRSIILVPMEILNSLKKKMERYEGEIIGYDPKKMSLRQAVATIIQDKFPHAFRLVNKNKTDICTLSVSDGKRNIDISVCSHHDYNQACGYFNAYYIKTEDEEIELMDSPSTIRLAEYREYTQGRHVGLHHGSATDIESHASFKKLKAVSEHPESAIAKNMSVLVGAKGAKFIPGLLSVEAYHKYEDLQRYHKGTGLRHYADYLVKKAMIADCRSIHFELGMDGSLKSEQLKSIIDDHYEELLNNLAAVATSGSKSDLLAYRKSLLDAYMKVLGIRELKIAADPSISASSRRTSVVPAAGPALPAAGNVRVSRSGHSFWSTNRLAVGIGALVAGGLIVGAAYLLRNRNSG
ncbi:hypothetical protein AQUSIP_04010 [Aquicella siphonis]|uniref:Uncharacterized protein n=1 Tax=Aquicella siphonis TaxID=254247 RepID=A0A5E4PET7_9COXI|nr:hypothetical protein [Aquicella siphonis]VVC75125.1 hypothetical protein AQUSIP_04010 [Aquicella siphonis]